MHASRIHSERHKGLDERLRDRCERKCLTGDSWSVSEAESSFSGVSAYQVWKAPYDSKRPVSQT